MLFGSTFIASGSTLAFISFPGNTEWIVILVLGLLIFGRRLPEVGRSLGRGIVEFKRGIKGIEDDVDEESSRPGRPPARLEDQPSASDRVASTVDYGSPVAEPRRESTAS